MRATSERLPSETNGLYPIMRRRSSIFRSSTLLLHLISLFPAAVLGHRTGNGKTLEKQVTTIAQKIVDAKHTEQERRWLIAAPNPRAFTFGTAWPDHLFTL
jgi:hypothetical protein